MGEASWCHKDGESPEPTVHVWWEIEGSGEDIQPQYRLQAGVWQKEM